uniref:MARVEL domain-containing protein n=1 Tax=Caenorhabditis tropicalis TaxID=1561998 RepID=A0A1I7T0T5_9PELO
MYTSSSSYDDRPFASGVVTTQTNDSFDMNVVKIHSSDESSYDLTMDKTQSASPADIPERVPRFCSLIHFKTLSHLIAICSIPLIIVETVLIFQSTTFHKDSYQHIKTLCELAGPLNLASLSFTSSHIFIYFFKRKSTLRSANLTFWVTILTTGSLFITGFLLLTANPESLSPHKVIVPSHFIAFFASIISTIMASFAVFYEWKSFKNEMAH